MKAPFTTRLYARLVSIAELLAHLARSQRLVLIPLVCVLLFASVVFVFTSGLAYVAPFVYALF